MSLNNINNINKMKHFSQILIVLCFVGCAAPKKAETKIKSSVYRFAPESSINYHCPYSSLDEMHRKLYNSNSH